MTHTFNERLRAVQQDVHSVVCVGLDPDPAHLPPHLTAGRSVADAVRRFCHEIVEATAPSACAFKLNLAFFEVLGAEGWQVLADVVRAIPAGPLVILDAKRGDIGNSARFYAQALFEELRGDACTVAPYMGFDSVEPFLQYRGRAAFVLARTSNPGAADFQEAESEGEPLYLRVARSVQAWAERAPGDAGLVVGATGGDALARIRAACPTLPFLVPGIGAQGGDAAAVMAAATDDGAVIVNSSRQILYASSGTDYAEAAGREARALRDQLRTAA